MSPRHNDESHPLNQPVRSVHLGRRAGPVPPTTRWPGRGRPRTVGPCPHPKASTTPLVVARSSSPTTVRRPPCCGGRGPPASSSRSRRQDPQELMARLTGNYRRGNERAARNPRAAAATEPRGSTRDRAPRRPSDVDRVPRCPVPSPLLSSPRRIAGRIHDGWSVAQTRDGWQSWTLLGIVVVAALTLRACLSPYEDPNYTFFIGRWFSTSTNTGSPASVTTSPTTTCRTCTCCTSAR